LFSYFPAPPKIMAKDYRTRRHTVVPESAGFPILGYYAVALLAIGILIIFYNVFTVANFSNWIREAEEEKLGSKAAEVRDRLETRYQAHSQDVRLVANWLKNYSSTHQGFDLASLQPAFENAAAAALDRFDAPVSAFVTEVPRGEPLDFDRLRPPLLRVTKGENGQWGSELERESNFWREIYANPAREALRQDEVTSTGLFLASNVGGSVPMTAFLIPVISADDRRLILGVSYNMRPLFEPLRQVRIGDTGGILLVDRGRGTVLAAPQVTSGRQQSAVLNLSDPFTYNLFRDSRYSDWQKVLNRPIGGAEVLGDDDRWYLAVASTLPELNWAVLAYISNEEITDQIRDRSLPVALLGLALFLSILTAIFLLNRSLAYPLQRLIRAVTRPLPTVNEDNIEAMQTQEDGPREFATLAAGYNRLIATIGQAVHSKNEYAKKLETSHQRLKGFNKLLEKVVADRTSELKTAKEAAELARENAENAQRAAEKANEAKSNFLANISHELRTPLNAIIGYTELLMEEAEDTGSTESMEDLEKVLSAGKHLLSLIDDILDIAKIEAGRMRLNIEEFSVSEMLKEVLEGTHPLTRDNGNRLVFHNQLGDISMVADRKKVKQILLNLTSNACKFTEKGTITLSARRSAADPAKLTFEVSDTGIGMSAAQVRRVFEKFSQADETSTRKHGGSGLGLFICKIFSEMMYGDITLKSEEGQGSAFQLHVPQNVDKVREEDPNANRVRTSPLAGALSENVPAE
jgi:signal transduction histidine kinase